MASHYDAHERQRTSRHDSFHRPRDQEPSHHRKHSAGYASRGSARGGDADTVRGSSGSERKAFRRSYDPRDSAYYAPPPSVEHGRPHRRGSPNRRRHSWPPQPFVEEESRSLAREAGAQALWRDIQRAEAPPSRGIIDQEQIIEEVSEYRTTVAKPDENNVNPSDLKYNVKTHSTGILTPPTSEDERARKLRRKPSKLNTNLEEAVPEMSKRTSSPYAFSKPAPLTRGFSSSRQFLSPDSITPPPSGFEPRRHTQSISTSKPSTPRVETRRTSPGARVGQDYFSSFGSGDNAVFDDERHKQRRGPSPLRDEPAVPTPSSFAGYDDWYTVIGAPQLVFCPDCVDKVFERTIFRPSVRRMPQLNLDSKIQCSLGASHWARLAWVLTLQQHRTDFTLLKDVAEIEETSEPCPGHKEAVRTWYGLRDSEGLYVRDFHLCYADVRKLERLLPMLNGFFVPLPSRASHGKYKCAFRVDSNRFNVYLDALITTHERSLNTHKVPDKIAFIDLVERKTQLRDCTKDTLLIGGLWHLMPKIPEFTICEDCFDAIVEPEVKRNNDLAMRFNRTIQPAYGEGLGSSCQLYSRRMRRVFQRAIEDNDLRYLARKAKERREAELRLQERYQDVIRKAKRLSKEGTGTGDDEKRLNRELQVITDEWKTRWE
ncbi:hypothetical protein Tdes44962_MAKER05272 [Teratosphaeria destructans]|uniref:Uncharacterized protein n=1 Tax=Teratosphaeria destructans TaxID=418781 RepID=A0A9W7SKB2_9PEZI|nr:hypothetical protein Tdes44962_MAKER05272 [Teratosphaeria destructans]